MELNLSMLKELNEQICLYDDTVAKIRLGIIIINEQSRVIEALTKKCNELEVELSGIRVELANKPKPRVRTNK